MIRPYANRALVVAPCSKRAVAALFLATCGVLYFSIGSSSNIYLNTEVSTRFSVEQMKNFAFKNSISTDFKPSYYTRWNYSYSKLIENQQSRFNISGSDVLVFLHIQKTAGTSFEKYLVKFLELDQPCVCIKGRKRCSCRRPNNRNEIWLFSRYSTGWVCGLHADFTELFVSNCVDTAMDKKEGVHKKRRYFYTTFLREPISRFISEYRHVNRGATWIGSRHVCNGRPPTPDELPMCFDPQIGWDSVSLDEFLHCPFNLAFNRQTRMLADLTLVNCYSRTGMTSETRDRIMLESAKNNLRNLAYFGLKERMSDSQFMFEQLFGLRFTKSLSDWGKSKSNGTTITNSQMTLIQQRNAMDIELYEYALKLFNKRLKQMKSDVQIFVRFGEKERILLQTSQRTVSPEEDVFFVRDTDQNNVTYEEESYENYDDIDDHQITFTRV